MHLKTILFSLAALSFSNNIVLAADCFSGTNPKVASVDFQAAQNAVLHPVFADEFDSIFLDDTAPLILATVGSAKICVRNENFEDLTIVQIAKEDMLGGIANIYSQCFDGAGSESAGGTFHVNGKGGQGVVYVMSSEFYCFNGQEFPSF